MLSEMARSTNHGSGDDAFVGPRNVLAALALLSLMVVAWLESRPVGEGERERPDHLMLVVPEDQITTEQTLRNAGFVVEVAGLTGTQDAPAPLADLLEEADERGIGFLVVSDATTVDPAELEFGGETWPNTRTWVTVSVGDLAFPHHLTTASTEGQDVGMASLSVLGMIFEQPRLDRERESLTQSPALDELLLNARLEAGMNIVDRAASQRRLSMDMEQRLAGRLDGDPGVHPLLDPLAVGGALPVGPQVLLTTKRAINFVIEPDANLEDVLEDEVEFRRVELDDRGRVVSVETCTETFEGPLSAADFQSLRVSPDGYYLALQRRDGRVLFYEEVPSAVCRYALAGEHRVSPGVDAGVVGVRGVTAGTELVEGGARVVFRYRDGSTRRGPVVRATLRNPAWLDDSHVVVPGSDDEEEPGVGAALYVFSLHEQEAVEKITLPAEVARRGVSTVVVSDSAAREVIVSSGRAPTSLYLATLGDPAEAVPRRPVKTPKSRGADAGAALEGPTTRSPLHEAPPPEVRVRPVARIEMFWAVEDSYDLNVSEDGRALALATAGEEFIEDHGVQSRRYRVAVLDLSAARRGTLRVDALVESTMSDRKPLVVPQSELVIMSSRGRLGLRRREVVTPRVARIEGLTARGRPTR